MTEKITSQPNPYRVVHHPKHGYGLLSDKHPVEAGAVHVYFIGDDPHNPYRPIRISSLDMLAGFDLVNDGGRLPALRVPHPLDFRWGETTWASKISRNLYQHTYRERRVILDAKGNERTAIVTRRFVEQHGPEIRVEPVGYHTDEQLHHHFAQQSEITWGRDPSLIGHGTGSAGWDDGERILDGAIQDGLNV